MEPFYAVLVAGGRKTCRPHAVRLCAVYEGRMYFSRHRQDGDWFKNALADPAVEARYDGLCIHGRALEADSGLAEIVRVKVSGRRARTWQ